jgi:protein-tyrosine phosphatase
MKESINEVIPNQLYIGDSTASSNLKLLQSMGITHIVNTASEIPNSFQGKFHYLNLGLHDHSKDEDLFRVLEPSYRYIRSVMQHNPKSKIFVHCHAGISRSASTVIYYLMRTNNWTFDQAYKFLKSKRSIVRPNSWYTQQLRDVGYLLNYH